MPTTALFLLALGMSVDAGVAALGRGAVTARMRLRLALRLGLVFGLFEAVMPVLGWAAAQAAAPLLAAIDHWIAWGLLSIIGLRMIRGGGSDGSDGADDSRTHQLSIPALAFTALATSVDAMAVGVSLAFAHVPILPVALASGGATFVMASAGALIGSHAGLRSSRYAETGGGLLLMALGGWILATSLAG